MAKTKLTKETNSETTSEVDTAISEKTEAPVAEVEASSKKKTKPKTTKGKSVKANSKTKAKKKTAAKKGRASSKKKVAKKAKTKKASAKTGKKASRTSKVTEPTRGNFFTTNIAVPVALVQKLDQQIKSGKYNSRSEFFREVGAKRLGVKL